MYRKQKFVVSEAIFAARLAHGPLDHWERLYREFLSSEFWELLNVEPWLKTAGPSVRGRRILVPLIRQVLRHLGELPADMVEWVQVYQRLTKALLAYFDAWTKSGSVRGNCRPQQNQHLRVVGA